MAHPIATTETLKQADRFYDAGRLAFRLGHPNTYGCHYGMRSTRDAAAAAFAEGYRFAANAPRRDWLTITYCAGTTTVLMADGVTLAFDRGTIAHETRLCGCEEGDAALILARRELVRELDNAL